MIHERLRERLKKDRPTTTVTLTLPVDVLESLKRIAPRRGFNSYRTLLKSYISAGLQRDDVDLTTIEEREHPNDRRHDVIKKKYPHVGSSLDDFLKAEGMYEEAQNTAIRHLLAEDIAKAMKTKHLTKVQMAERMQLSVPQLSCLLDPHDPSVTLAAVNRASAVIGRKLLLDLV